MEWFVLVVLSVTCRPVGSVGWDIRTPLDDYVDKPDPHYNYSLLHQDRREGGITFYLYNMTSQKWNDASYSSRSVWFHYLKVAVPDKPRTNSTAVLMIGADLNTKKADPEDSASRLVIKLSRDTLTVVALLEFVPNQPITFRADPEQERRKEDAILAYSWRDFIEDTNNPEKLVWLAMTKSAVKAMDTVTEVTRSSSINISSFIVAGRSKRGWTTFLTASTDRRVVGIIPMVFTMLNSVKNLHHHYRCYGGWTYAFRDYHRQNLSMLIDHPNFQKSCDINDPYSYIERLTMPKLLVLATGDQFFLPDESRFFFDKMVGRKYMRLVDNTGHMLSSRGRTVYDETKAFILSLIESYTMPTMTWFKNETESSGSITLQTSTTPSFIEAWYAKTVNRTRRDFRLVTNEGLSFVNWTSSGVVEDLGNNNYYVTFEKDPGAYLGFYLKATFDGPEGNNLVFTTELNVIPDTYPFPACHGYNCRGTIV